MMGELYGIFVLNDVVFIKNDVTQRNICYISIYL